MRNDKLFNALFTFFYTLFHLPSSIIYILHIICISIFNTISGKVNGFNFQEFMNERFDDAEKFMSIRDYIDYSFWGIIFVYINFIK
jgi:hypothetical protein